MIGKLITVGITEQGKSPAETAMVTKSDVTGVWGNPSEGDPNRLVWKDFVSHDHLFYDSRNPSGWDFVDHDSMMFTLSVTDATGVFVNCNGPSFGLPNGLAKQLRKVIKWASIKCAVWPMKLRKVCRRAAGEGSRRSRTKF